MTDFQLSGCTLEELQELVAEHLPGRAVTINPKGRRRGKMGEVELLKAQLEEKTQECLELEEPLAKQCFLLRLYINNNSLCLMTS